MEFEQPGLVRHQVVGGVSSVAVAAPGSGAAAQTLSPPMQQTPLVPPARGEDQLEDPVTAYPRPPFARQQPRDPPGLASLITLGRIVRLIREAGRGGP